MNLSRAIKFAMIESDMGSGEVAKKVGISKSYFSQIANGHRSPSVELAVRIARAMGYRFDEFVCLGFKKTA